MDNENVHATQNLLKQCIQEQCDEVEMLQSIFCNAGEMKVCDHSILTDMFDYLEGKTDALTQKLDYTIRIPMPGVGQTLELQMEFPHTYPSLEQPCITVRTTLQTSDKGHIEHQIKHRIYELIASDDIDRSTVYVYPIIVWLQENIDDIVASASKLAIGQKAGDTSDSTNTNTDQPIEMERLWIYSHHLKSTQKRQDILKLAKDLDLTGFSKPGKPGIICVEGAKENTQEFWKIIRQWAWQRITLRINESKIKPTSKCNQFRRFKQFGEKLCGDDTTTESVAPINMSEFMKFLENHNCGYVKKELLLLE